MLKLINDRRSDEKGFTLAELLIVVAIIAVLIAISIPIFTKRLENSRETTDLANLRAAYAAGQVAAMAGEIDAEGEKTSAYNPDASTGLVAQGAGTKLGKGTATEGGATTTGIPSQIKYSTDKAYSGKEIQLTFSNGDLTTVQFAN